MNPRSLNLAQATLEGQDGRSSRSCTGAGRLEILVLGASGLELLLETPETFRWHVPIKNGHAWHKYNYMYSLIVSLHFIFSASFDTLVWPSRYPFMIHGPIVEPTGGGAVDV